MLNINKIVVGGRICKDAEVRTFGKNGKLLNFCVAATYGKEPYREDFFAECVAYNKVAELIAPHAKKGSSILVFGRMRTDKWVDKTSGKTRSKCILYVEQYQMFDTDTNGATDVQFREQVSNNIPKYDDMVGELDNGYSPEGQTTDGTGNNLYY